MNDILLFFIPPRNKRRTLVALLAEIAHLYRRFDLVFKIGNVRKAIDLVFVCE